MSEFTKWTIWLESVTKNPDEDKQELAEFRCHRDGHRFDAGFCTRCKAIIFC